jgi:hypothetical protein
MERLTELEEWDLLRCPTTEGRTKRLSAGRGMMTEETDSDCKRILGYMA